MNVISAEMDEGEMSEYEENDEAFLRKVFAMNPGLRVEPLVQITTSEPNAHYKNYYKISGKGILVDGRKLPAVTVQVVESDENFKVRRACEVSQMTSTFLKCVHVLYTINGRRKHRSYIFNTPSHEDTELNPEPKQSAWQRLKGRFTPRKSWGETLKSWRPWGGRRPRRKKKTRRHGALK